MIVIDHWACACCKDKFAYRPARNIDELVRFPICPHCGSTRVQIELASVFDPNGRRPSGRIRDGNPQIKSHSPYAAKAKDRPWKVIIGR